MIDCLCRMRTAFSRAHTHTHTYLYTRALWCAWRLSGALTPYGRAPQQDSELQANVAIAGLSSASSSSSAAAASYNSLFSSRQTEGVPRVVRLSDGKRASCPKRRRRKRQRRQQQVLSASLSLSRLAFDFSHELSALAPPARRLAQQPATRCWIGNCTCCCHRLRLISHWTSRAVRERKRDIKKEPDRGRKRRVQMPGAISPETRSRIVVLRRLLAVIAAKGGPSRSIELGINCGFAEASR